MSAIVLQFPGRQVALRREIEWQFKDCGASPECAAFVFDALATALENAPELTYIELHKRG